MKKTTLSRIRKAIKDKTVYRWKKYKSWRKKIFERDRYRCQMPGCDKVGGHLNAHHIKMKYLFPELIFHKLNGITLCLNCHQDLHARKAEKDYEKVFKEIAKKNKPKPRVKKIYKRRKSKKKEE